MIWMSLLKFSLFAAMFVVVTSRVLDARDDVSGLADHAGIMMLLDVDGCPPGWSKKLPNEEPLCYKFFDTKETFDTAQANCKSFGGQLAMPKTKEQQYVVHRMRVPCSVIKKAESIWAFVKDMVTHLLSFGYLFNRILPDEKLRGYTWIGLTDRNSEDRYSWEDGTRLGGWNNWQSLPVKQPDNYEGREHCAQLLPTGSWNDEDCDRVFNYICQKEAKIERCPEGTTYHENADMCYGEFTNVRLSHDGAIANCQLDGLTLAMPKNDAQLEALIDLRSPIDSPEPNPYFWIGMTRNQETDEFEWDDGSEVDFQSWHNGEPNNAGGKEDCVHVRNNDKWNDEPCDARLTYVCQTLPLKNKFIDKVIEKVGETEDEEEEVDPLKNKFISIDKVIEKIGGTEDEEEDGEEE